MEYQYDAFISYRHAPLDSKVAAKIQSDLENFSIQKALQKSCNKKRLGPIYLDKEELPVNSDLSDDIKRALVNSKYLIVICSTNTVSSVWVPREIEYFLKTHDRQHVLTVLANGEPGDVIPDILCHEETNVLSLSCDYRKKRSAAKREELPRLAAAILGCSCDELRQRQRKRQIRQAVSVFSAVLLLVAVIAAFAMNRAFVIEEENRNALINQSRYLAKTSGELLEQGDRMGAIQVALAALPASEGDNSRPLVSEALYALNNAVYPYHLAQADEYLPKCMMKIDGKGTYTKGKGYWQRFSPSRTRWMIMDDAGLIYVLDLKDYKQIAALAPSDVASEDMGHAFISADFITEGQIVLYLGNGAVCWDIHKCCSVWTTKYEPVCVRPFGLNSTFENADTLVDQEHHTLFAAFVVSQAGFAGELSVYRFDSNTGKVQAAITTDALLPSSVEFPQDCHLALSPDGTRAAVGVSCLNEDAPRGNVRATELLLVDLENETYQMVMPEYGDVVSLMFLSNNQLCLFATDTIATDYYSVTSSSLPYAVELRNFEDGSLVWSTHGDAMIQGDLLDVVRPTSFIQLWHQTLHDGGSQDLLIVQYGGELLLLNPADGAAFRTSSLHTDIVYATVRDSESIFLVLRNGKIMQYLPESQVFNELGHISCQLRSAVFSAALEEFFLAVDGSQNIVVMSSKLEDDGGTISNVSLKDVYYATNGDREYRIIQQHVSGDENSSSREWLQFYVPLSDTPFAVTNDAVKIDDIQMYFSDEGEDICYYINKTTHTSTLCGWGMQRNQKVFEYSVPAGEILGFHDEQILYQGRGALWLIDPKSKTDKAIQTGGSVSNALSPDGKYAAVVTHSKTNDPLQLYLIDVENWVQVEIPDKLQTNPFLGTEFHSNLAFSPDSSKLAAWTGSEIVILDLDTMTISQCIQIPCKYRGYSMFLNDHILLVYGDSGRLTSWDLNTQSVVMEDPYEDITDSPQLLIGNGYFQAGGNHPNLYAYDENGKFIRYLSVPCGVVSSSGSEVISFFNEPPDIVTAIRFYPLYTLDELVAKASEILDGRTLTEAERIQYFIDS